MSTADYCTSLYYLSLMVTLCKDDARIAAAMGYLVTQNQKKTYILEQIHPTNRINREENVSGLNNRILDIFKQSLMPYLFTSKKKKTG